ncbi:bifunctional hydroxymethylpyrimidine kinase/phosphomethylpyrimidine kinase [Microbacterium indicum]|uniref:bifunctional hydroxymethylpyrimidine kinase/phosphomethylpyrimidine kinase n=1 Tax=Microbacterium indicum TaxID=358100 RepID=UPI000562A0A2|nr:bifunctional hydroxymethylpyrimidine kinase/phosphomethylpyrimidine kinase [Microbacterium indicum]
MIPRVLSIAGTDPTGGAGIQADLKSIAAHGGYGMAVVTALVAQNTRGVLSVHTPPQAFLAEQLDAVSDDVAIDAVKIGMLGDAATIATVRAWLERVRPPRVVLDPVMIATSGDRLLARDAEQALRDLVPLADVVTPNAPELAVLAGEPVATSVDGLERQARALAAATGTRVLAKGGHLGGQDATDAIVDPSGARRRFSSPRIATSSTHGTGCSLSSALAALAARDGDWVLAAGRAHDWLHSAIAAGEALRVGRGHGPVHHAVEVAEAMRGAGPITSEWWRAIGPVRAEIERLPFVRALGDGTLDREAFRWYLAQDAVYLEGYGELLLRASELADEPSEAEFWRQSAAGAEAEAEGLHLRWTERAETPSPVTAAYLDHLAGSAGYAVLAAALLPCFWIYQDVGAGLAGANHEGHPYAGWLSSYGDEAFAASTRRATAVVERLAARAAPAERAAMAGAFALSAEHERAFFAAPLRVPTP